MFDGKAGARLRTLSGIGVLALLLAGLGGCVDKYTDYDAFMKRPRPTVGGKAYVIEPPDVVRVTCPQVEEIDGRTFTLRPDGYITLALIGEVFAAGSTPRQLSQKIQVEVNKVYQNKQVQVEVVGFNSKFYYLAGETTAGRYPYTGKDTVIDVVLGRIPRTAWPEHALVIRPNEDGELIRRMSLDLRDLYEKGDLKYNALLEEGDIVFIPINPFAAVGVFFQNLLSPVSPVLNAASTPARLTGIPTP